ncbi:short chain dehydrogenase [Thraustotheca clavata]|uniref:Short chain dehydrogenase n=1 Tax=Thraustotheca clavata TaxID=74557 RepID=A0A1W0A502_9STRA|nr:short chain dehydrogenase [Thraustotheca clavata]
MGNCNSNEPLKPKNFNAKTTAAQDADAFADHFKNKVVVITGSNSGLGLETARVIASKGGIVVIACRTPSKGESAVASILKEFPECNVTFLPLNLASLASGRDFVPKFEAKFDRLNILIDNAGVMLVQEL